MKQRKLFPSLTENQNISCPDVCVDSTCSTGCYPYSDVYPFPPPLLETAPPSQSHQHISVYIIVIIALLASCFLLISYYVLIVKYCSRWNLFRPRRRQPRAAAEEEFLDENRSPEIIHPIWYINTVGLQPSIINSITIFRYKTGDTLIDGTDCAVCLNEFQNDETLRLLPKCNHAFHIPCIDTWLRSHTNCPVCRAGIVSDALAAPQPSDGLNSIVQEEVENNSAEINGDLNSSNLERDDELCTNGMDTENGIVNESEGIENEKMSLDLVIDYLKGSSMMMEDVNHEKEPIKRSISVDSLVAANISEAVLSLCLDQNEEISLNPRFDDVQNDSSKHGGGNSRIKKIVGGSSITQILHKKPVRMKRSFSYTGRPFVSRQHPSSISILPL